ncbi:hypothetical protein HanIR_Chr17g0898871 [Helianthus annuus]|nr:hypothetical protein HanIR_Chr17g0898871 [Helianthus annuus]
MMEPATKLVILTKLPKHPAIEETPGSFIIMVFHRGFVGSMSFRRVMTCFVELAAYINSTALALKTDREQREHTHTRVNLEFVCE